MISLSLYLSPSCSHSVCTEACWSACRIWRQIICQAGECKAAREPTCSQSRQTRRVQWFTEIVEIHELAGRQVQVPDYRVKGKGLYLGTGSDGGKSRNEGTNERMNWNVLVIFCLSWLRKVESVEQVKERVRWLVQVRRYRWEVWETEANFVT